MLPSFPLLSSPLGRSVGRSVVVVWLKNSSLWARYGLAEKKEGRNACVTQHRIYGVAWPVGDTTTRPILGRTTCARSVRYCLGMLASPFSGLTDAICGKGVGVGLQKLLLCTHVYNGARPAPRHLHYSIARGLESDAQSSLLRTYEPTEAVGLAPYTAACLSNNGRSHHARM